MITITQNQARAYICNQQLLNTKINIPASELANTIINHLGYIQIDTISVVARAHHHIFWTRNKKYTSADLQKLEEERKVYEYWAHAASYLPINDFRYSLYPKKKHKEGKGLWRNKNKKVMKYVLDQFRSEGPLMSKDFKKDPSLNYDHAWGGHPITSALRQLFMEGEIMISGRPGFHKLYDLTERVLPSHINTSHPTPDEYYNYLILRDIKSNGLMKAGEFGHLITIPKKTLAKLLDQLCEDNVLTKVSIKKLDGQTYYAAKEVIEQFESPRTNSSVKILSPFDNLLINRKRTKEIFDFDYTLECYVTAKKRKVGYFSLPLLYKNQLIGQTDLKADRKTRTLIVNNLVWNPEVRISDKGKQQTIKAIEEFKKFNDCNTVSGLSQFF